MMPEKTNDEDFLERLTLRWSQRRFEGWFRAYSSSCDSYIVHIRDVLKNASYYYEDPRRSVIDALQITTPLRIDSA